MDIFLCKFSITMKIASAAFRSKKQLHTWHLTRFTTTTRDFELVHALGPSSLISIATSSSPEFDKKLKEWYSDESTECHCKDIQSLVTEVGGVQGGDIKTSLFYKNWRQCYEDDDGRPVQPVILKKEIDSKSFYRVVGFWDKDIFYFTSVSIKNTFDNVL